MGPEASVSLQQTPSEHTAKDPEKGRVKTNSNLERLKSS